jgi:hypothetical protein
MAIRLSDWTEPRIHSTSEGPDSALLYDGKAEADDASLLDEGPDLKPMFLELLGCV